MLNDYLDRELSFAYKYNASDVHFNSGEPVVFRVDGQLFRFPEHEKIYSREEIFGIACVLNPLLDRHLSDVYFVEELNGTSDFSFYYEVDGLNIRCRASLFSTVDGYSLAIRLFPGSIPSLEDLKCPRGVLKLATEFSHGLVIVTGPTGSGKSTTLAAMIDHINSNDNKRIITIEEPVEYIHRSKKSIVTHRELGRNCKTFFDGFKQSLREDPDIIFLGEIRDAETMKLAMEASESGHLVLSTLHSSDVLESLTRIIGMFPSELSDVVANQLSLSLSGIISQKLLKSKNGGRVAAYEVLINNPTVANIIRSSDMRHLPDYMRPEQGMIKFSDSLLGLRNRRMID